MAEALPERPRPEPGPDSQPYWDSLRRHALALQRCTRCGTPRLYPRPLCAHCHAFDHRWETVSGAGTVHSWTVAHHAFHPAFKRALPYTVLTVDLAEGVRLAAPLAGGGSPRLGAAVRLDYEDVDDELTLPCFRLLESAP